MTFRTRRSFIAAAFAVAGVAAACGGGASPPAPAVEEAATAAPAQGPTGRIRGVVRLAGDAPAERTLPVTENQQVCGQRVPVARLTLGPSAGVRNAFVYLDGVEGSGTARQQATLELGQEDCQYAPRASVMPPGGSLEIFNDDPILHNVHARESTPGGYRTIFNIAQPMQGQRTRLDAPFKSPGVVTVTCEAGHPWMAAYVLVADHPYVTVSGEHGEFTIENVPAGTYPLRMWHEGVQLTRVVERLQQYEYEEPYELTQEVAVPAGGEAVVEFELRLRE